MNFKRAVKKVLSAVLVGVTAVTLTFQAIPALAAKKPTQAEMEVDKYTLKELNTTPEGQRALFKYILEQKGVNNDPNNNFRLRSIMANLTNAVATIDPTVNDLPYLYFVNNDTSLNAFCTFGHIISVNAGTFKDIVNDDELAVIIGHEMGHGQKNHAYKGYKSAQQKVLFANIICLT